MAGVTVKLRRILLLLVVVAAAVSYQQYNRYLEWRKQLQQEAAAFSVSLAKIDEAKGEGVAFSQRLEAVVQRYDTLRGELPGSMNLEDFSRSLERLLAERGIEVLAQREAHHYRSLYQEVRLSYSLRGSVQAVQRVLAVLQEQPRLVLSDGPREESRKNTGLQLSVYSVPLDEPSALSVPECISEPGDLYLPYLTNLLQPVYQDYLDSCRKVSDEGELYLDIQRYQQLASAVNRLSSIRTAIIQAR